MLVMGLGGVGLLGGPGRPAGRGRHRDRQRSRWPSGASSADEARRHPRHRPHHRRRRRRRASTSPSTASTSRSTPPGRNALIETGINATRFGGTTVLVGVAPISEALHVPVGHDLRGDGQEHPRVPARQRQLAAGDPPAHRPVARRSARPRVAHHRAPAARRHQRGRRRPARQPRRPHRHRPVTDSASVARRERDGPIARRGGPPGRCATMAPPMRALGAGVGGGTGRRTDRTGSGRSRPGTPGRSSARRDGEDGPWQTRTTAGRRDRPAPGQAGVPGQPDQLRGGERAADRHLGAQRPGLLLADLGHRLLGLRSGHARLDRLRAGRHHRGRHPAGDAARVATTSSPEPPIVGRPTVARPRPRPARGRRPPVTFDAAWYATVIDTIPEAVIVCDASGTRCWPTSGPSICWA